jgi:diaminohydroxyphosphoribosylaminopyrimidine deaminase/5-amino-6-(5-phosphoribosylamino)uracil reductase
MDPHEIYMRRAFELARLGLGYVSPNPMVGCVIVHEDKIIGEGFHQRWGGPHAEVHAINAVNNQSLLKESTVFVTLEPCAHVGKTPPCANLLIQHQVKKVVIANIDPNPLVSGKGIKMMRDAGIEVETGLLEEEGDELNKRFFKSIMHQQPYIILKWAQTADGFIARSNFDSKWISNKYSRMLVHKWRAEEDAILVGKNTAKYDNPRLNVRNWEGKDPLRILIDHHLSLSEYLELLNGQIPTICYNTCKTEINKHLEYIRLDSSRFLEELVGDLHKRDIRSLIVEGGSNTLQQFIDAGLWDEARVFTAPVSFGTGIMAPQLINAKFDNRENIKEDILSYFRSK